MTETRETISMQLKVCTQYNIEDLGLEKECDYDKIENILKNLNLGVFIVNTNFQTKELD